MNSGINANDPTVVAAFRAALFHQGLIALVFILLVTLAWGCAKAWPPARTPSAPVPDDQPVGRPAEPAGRRLLRVGFGILWLFDGILQAQPAMAVGLPSKVIEPTAASSPAWVQHLVSWAGTSWSYHPIQAASAAVWIQVGIGIWLLVAPSGWWSRAAGLACVGWGLVVWVFGESFGGIFAPGLTWLFGAPGAALFYSAAGALIALPGAAWRTPRLGRAILAAMGAFLAGMALLQAWPGRGFWQGALHGKPGSLATMTQSMAQTSQPHSIAALINAFTSFDEAHGFAVNLVVVAALALIGVALLIAWRPVLLPAVIALGVLCLASWVLVQDMGIFGGLGTDPNSMIPVMLVTVGGYLALTRVPAPVTEPVVQPAAQPDAESAAQPAAGRDASPAAPVAVPVAAAPVASAAGRDQVRLASLRRSIAAASFRTVISVGALGLVILGVAPMAVAQASRTADPVLAEAISGSAAPLNFPAKGFTLTDQHGRTVSLASLRGKVVLLTFLDPVCTTDCPLIAQEFRQAGQLLGAASRQVELVAIVANPIYHQLAYTRAFDRQEDLTQVPNWLYLTGSVPQLQQVWKDYAIAALILPAGSMISHPDVAFIIDRAGRVRQELATGPGPGTTATKSSFAVMLADIARQALRSP